MLGWCAGFGTRWLRVFACDLDWCGMGLCGVAIWISGLDGFG